MIKKISYKDQVYEHLKHAIIMGDMEVGEIYSEQMIADMLNISRTPVREAIMQLKFENLIDIFSGRGFSVRPISFSDVQQIIQARTAIESTGLTVLVENADSDEALEVLSQMEECVKLDMKESLDAGHNYDFMQADMEFHMLSVMFTGNEFFIHIMRMMKARLEQAIVSSLKKINRPLVAIREHEEILNGLLNRDADAAVQALRKHMQVTENILSEMMSDR